MRPTTDVHRVFDLRAQGCSKAEIARRTGVSRSQVRGWLAVGVDAVLRSPMRERAAIDGVGRSYGLRHRSHCPLIATVDEPAYAYLLGQYLGDGTLTAEPRGVFRLRVITCDAYPMIRAECASAVHAVMPVNRVCIVQRRGQGCSEVVSYSKHWICLFPQHGAGRKHLRVIALKPWQRRIALDRYPRLLLRGLIHSDGCRVMNWVMSRDKSKRYTYSRYLFKNESLDILGIFTDVCDRLGVEYTMNSSNSVSVARRGSVAYLDTFIGPKS